MPGTNQLPSGSEFAVVISLIWALSSWICSVLLLWVTWAHREGGSYLALLGVSSFISNTFSIFQQGHDITWYAEIVTKQFEYKRTLPGNDPELAIAGGSYGLDLVLYYIQYYSYNVQAMLVMFWAAELCQLTWQVGERRKIRKFLRGLHTAGTFISFLFPLTTILLLRIPALKRNFLPFILVADLPLMLSLAIGSGLMIAVTVKYVQSRQKFTQWAPPKFTSANSASDAGTNTSGTQNSSHRTNGGSRSGGNSLYDRWLLVRFSITFVLLAIFEVTNTLFQVTALQNNLNDVAASAPDLSAGRAIQTFFLFMPGTTPGIFIYIVFGTTRSSRQKVAKLIPNWLKLPTSGLRACFTRITEKHSLASSTETLPTHEERGGGGRGGITVQRSLTVTSAARTARSSQLGGSGSGADSSESSDVWLKDLTPKRSHRALSTHQSSAKKALPPLPLSNKAATFNTTVTAGLPPPPPPARLLASPVPVSAFNNRKQLAEIKEKDDDESMSRTTTADSLRVPYYEDRCAEHSDDSGPILPIQRPEVRFSQDVIDAVRRASGRNRQSRNFSRPGL